VACGGTSHEPWDGADVVVSDVVDEASRDTLNLIEEAGGKGISIKADVSVSADVQKLIREIVDHYGHLDCAFNNTERQLRMAANEEGPRFIVGRCRLIRFPMPQALSARRPDTATPCKRPA
jgi:NAD(P)-dependent dehydrogenase (short-subunit alcohol dehydrogenase family)